MKRGLGVWGVLGIAWLFAGGVGCGSQVVSYPDPEFPPNPDPALPRGPGPAFGPVQTAVTPPAPLSGGTLRVLKDGHTAVVGDTDRDQLYVVDLKAHVVQHTIGFNAGDEPGRTVEDAAGRVHVVLRRGGALVTIDPQSWTVLARRSVCPAPRGLAYDDATDRVHVACAGGELISLPAAGGAAVRTVRLVPDLRDVMVMGTELWVTTFRAAQLLVVDSDGNLGSTGTVPSATPLGGPQFTSSVAWRMVPFANGAAIVHQQGREGPVQTVPGGYGSVASPCSELVRGVVSLVNGGVFSGGAALQGAVLPVDLAIAPRANEMAVLSAGNAHSTGLLQVMLLPLDGITPPSFVGGVQNAGDLCEPAVGAQVGGEAIALAYDGDDQLWVQTREPAALQRVAGAAVGLTTIALASDSRADTGWAVFHTNSGANIACASCHVEGGEDGRTWEFATTGRRRTQSLRGNVGGTAPFHWDGDLSSFDALVGEVYVQRMAGPTLATDEKQAFAAWVNTIPTVPASPAPDSSAASRGQVLFEDQKVGCADCHNGAQLTNNLTVDVGTGGKFQVPRLLGLGARAPYMHDGCAATLTSRFTDGCGGGDLHGKVSQLSTQQIADLVAYLETL